MSSPSNHYVLPIVGYLADEPQFEPAALEVARLLEVPMEHLLATKSLHMTQRRESGVCARAAAYLWEGEQIWGATCMILAEVAAVVREAVSDSSLRKNPSF